MSAPDGSLGWVLDSAAALLGVPGATDRLELAAGHPDTRQVVVLLIDGLGLHLLPRAAQSSALFADVLAGRTGSLRELASGFPSTTPVSLATLGTGAAPGAHGIIGFTVAVPATERLLTHIFWRDDPDPVSWQPVPTLLSRASAAGMSTAVVSRGEYRGSGLTRAVYGQPADYRATDSSDGMGHRRLAQQIVEALRDGVQLVSAYHPDLDTVMHRSGLGSQAWLDAAAEVGALIDHVANRLPPGALLLVTADHGGLDVPSEQRVDCSAIPGLLDGVRVVAGEPRARYLYTAGGAAGDVAARWRETLGPDVQVLLRSEAIEQGWFGPMNPEHTARIGDVIAVCTGRNAILASGWEPPEVGALIGMHGSIRPEETAVPLLTFTG